MIRHPLTQIALAIIFLPALNTNGQTAFTLANTKYVDSAEISMKKNWCDGVLFYPKKYSAQKVNDDQRIVETANDFLSENHLPGKFNPVIPKLKKGRISKHETRHGLIRVVDIVLQGKYIYANIKLDYIDTVVIRKNCSITFATEGRCTSSGYTVIDLNLLRRAFLNKFNFSFILFNNKELLTKNFFEDNLKIASGIYQGYKFHYSDPDTEQWINRIYASQFNSDSLCCYSYEKANADFVALIKNDKIEIIRDLVYSPNYYYAINAMEALLYLENVGRVSLEDILSRKFKEIMQQDFELMSQRAEDVFVTVRGYKELNVTTAQVIQKYKLAMR